MSRASVLARGRTAAEAGMVDACTITHAGAATTDDLTGAVTGSPTAVYTGACRVQQPVAAGQREDVGEMSVVMLRLVLQLPVVGSEDVTRGDLVTITSCVNDAALVGRVFRIHDLAHKSEATARRFAIEEVT